MSDKIEADCVEPVLIAGAGPVGLSLAVELTLRGVRCAIVDPRSEVRPFRKANGCNARSFEHFRRWGVAQRVRDAAPLPAQWSDDILFVTRLTGYTLATMAGVKHGVERTDLSAENYQRVPQWLIERLLREQLEASGLCRMIWGKRLADLSDNGERVTAVLEDANGERTQVAARFVVGCDGTRSRVRELLGIGFSEEAVYSKNANVTFHCPGLAALANKPAAVHYWYLNNDVSGHFSPQDTSGSWLLTSTWLDADADVDYAALVKAAIGAEIDFEIREASTWWANSYVAESYRRGNVFLCGDACHVHPPTGGYGMNQGIGDAVDLGWKLAAVIEGWGGPALLASYEAERRLVNQAIVHEAVDNWRLAGRELSEPAIEVPGPAGEECRRRIGERVVSERRKQFDSLGLILGYQYAGSPILVDDGAPAQLQAVTEYVPSARPGSRAPHLWLADGRSLYDTFGPWFTLLDLAASADLVAEFVAAARELGVPLAVRSNLSPRLSTLYETDLALIRPDQHIAWRRHLPVASARDILAVVAGRMN